MNPTEDLERRIRRLRVSTDDALDQRILNDASARLETSGTPVPLEPLRTNVWRTVMRSNWTKLSAAVLVAAAVVAVMSLRQVTPSAYALEQTIEANRLLRYLHICIQSSERELREAWAQFDENGKLVRLRMNLPKTEDGDKEVVFEGNKAEVWFKSKGHVLVLNDKEAAEKVAREMTGYDPVLVMNKLQQAEKVGEVEIETVESSAAGDPVTLNVSYKDSPNLREVYQIDPETKLVVRLDRFRTVDGKQKRTERIEYHEHNQEIPAGTFVLDVPDDAMRVDWTTQNIGLPQGDFTDKEMAVKVAREFFQALIDKDYAKAGQIYEGIPAKKIEEVFGWGEWVRIVSIGEPSPHPNPRTRFLCVPCEVEVRLGEKSGVQKFTPNIRPNEALQDRWTIGGGI